MHFKKSFLILIVLKQFIVFNLQYFLYFYANVKLAFYANVKFFGRYLIFGFVFLLTLILFIIYQPSLCVL